jgi:hypothetical protein
MADPKQTDDPVLRSYQLPELLNYEAAALILGISPRTLRRIVEAMHFLQFA